MGNKYLNGGEIVKAGKRVFLSVTMVLMIGLLSVSGSYAYNEADVQKLSTTNSCQRCDLTNAPLSHWGLDYANLRGANLSGASLSGANLCYSCLAGANLRGANLSGATWTDGSKCKDGSIGKCNK
jgi:uncharacterized protein YjbI with pentapeptide repeats